MSESAPPSRKTAAPLITGLILLPIAIVVGIDHGRLSHVERSLRANDGSAGLANLSSQFAVLASDVQTLKAAPRVATEASMNALKAEWEARLKGLEDASAAMASAAELAALKTRMDVVEMRLARSTRKSTPAATAITGSASGTNSAPSVSAKLDPPFLPLGIELRGGEQFLLIVPAGASSIAKARALRPGDREGAWTLERLERDAAHFRVEGQLQRLGVPQ